MLTMKGGLQWKLCSFEFWVRNSKRHINIKKYTVKLKQILARDTITFSDNFCPLFIDRPYLQLYLYLQTPTDTNAFQVKEDQYANVSSMVVKAQAWPAVNPSNSSPAITEKLIANISNERNESLISNRCRVDVHEGGDVRLTIVMEAYPPVKHQKWMTPAYMSNTDNTVFEESYTAGEDRSAC